MKKKFVYSGKKSWLAGIEPARADWHSLEDTELNHLAIWPSRHCIVWLQLNIFDNNLITKLKLKNLEISRSSYFLLYFEFFSVACSGAEINYITLD